MLYIIWLEFAVFKNCEFLKKIQIFAFYSVLMCCVCVYEFFEMLIWWCCGAAG